MVGKKFLELAEASRVKGNKYYNAGKFEKAIECYNEAIRMYPEGSEGLVLAYSNLAACHIKSVSGPIKPKVISEISTQLKYNNY